VAIFLYEFFGTACVIYACICSGGNIFSWPFTLLIYLLVARQINGGHANPAVTAGFYVYEVLRREEGRTFLEGIKRPLVLVVAQIFGAFFGVCLSYLILEPHVLRSDPVEFP
jgi:glycerol uptake facilitator-like aquaporin